MKCREYVAGIGVAIAVAACGAPEEPVAAREQPTSAPAPESPITAELQAAAAKLIEKAEAAPTKDIVEASHTLLFTEQAVSDGLITYYVRTATEDFTAGQTVGIGIIQEGDQNFSLAFSKAADDSWNIDCVSEPLQPGNYVELRRGKALFLDGQKVPTAPFEVADYMQRQIDFLDASVEASDAQGGNTTQLNDPCMPVLIPVYAD